MRIEDSGQWVGVAPHRSYISLEYRVGAMPNAVFLSGTVMALFEGGPPGPSRGIQARPPIHVPRGDGLGSRSRSRGTGGLSRSSEE